MSSAFHRRLLGPLLLAVSAGALHAATPVIGAQLFQDTNARIDDLFQYRNNRPKPPGRLDNPFRPIDAVVAPSPVTSVDASGAPTKSTVHETPDEAQLRQAYGRLNFGGLIMVGGRPMVVINKATYKEGALLIVRVEGTAVYLRIESLTPDTITLGLNEARLMLHF